MANFCLVPAVADKFKQDIISGKINPETLAEMTSMERHAFFAKELGDANAAPVNSLFESKLLLKNQQQGYVNWAKRVLNTNPKVQRDVLAKIQRLEKVLNPSEEKAFLEDLAASKLGTHVTFEEAQKITELSRNMQDKKATTNLSGVSPEYLQARQALHAYMGSLNAPSATSSIIKNLGIIGRNNLLLNPATPIKATVGQVVNSTMEAVSRRLSSLSGGSNSDLVAQANKEAWDTFRKTGVNTASMESIDDTHVLGKGENFKLPTESSVRGVGTLEKVVRNTAKISNKIAIDWEHNFTFTKFYQKTFFDTANIRATTLAKDEGLTGDALKTRAAEIFKDSVRVQPQTDSGAVVRQMAQEQSARVTSTNNTLASRFALGAKKALNNIIPGVPLGDFILPIAKIPASIIANGIDNAGAGIPKGFVDVFQGRAKMQSVDMATKYQGSAQFAKGVQRLMRIGGTIGTAALVASQFKKEDFRSDQYGNHFVRIGNAWINTEYISAISPALAGFMNMKAHGGKGFTNAAGQYTGGALASLKSTPGIDEANSLITSITNTDLTKGIKKYASDFFTSRGVPMFIKNLENNRPIERLFFGSTGVESSQQYQQDLKAKAAKAAATRKANKK